MVQYIKLAIPPGMFDAYNPTKDAALMARVGAVMTSDVINPTTKDVIGSIYEVKNTTTGASFKMWLWREWENDTMIDCSYFLLERMD